MADEERTPAPPASPDRLLCPACCRVRRADGGACPYCGGVDTAPTIEPSVTYYCAFTAASDGVPPSYVLTPDSRLLPPSPTWTCALREPINFTEATRRARSWSVRGDLVEIRLRGLTYTYEPRPANVVAFEAYAARGAREFAEAMAEAEASDEELPF